MCSGEEQVRVDELHLTVQLLHVKRTSGPWERAARLGSPRAEVCVRPETTLFLTYYVKALPVLRNGTLSWSLCSGVLWARNVSMSCGLAMPADQKCKIR